MSSPLLALFARSLREDARGRMTYLARGGVAGFLLLTLLIFTFNRSWQGAPGLGFFATIVGLQVVCITIAGLGYFASTVTEEKEDLTLGLLRMTDLGALSILLGKSTSRLCSALLLLVAQFPFMLLAVTFGGVSGPQVVASCLTLAAYTFFLCNLALLASVLAPRTAGAAMLTALGVLIYFAAGPLLGAALAGMISKGWLASGSGLGQTLAGVAAALNANSLITRLVEVLATGFFGEVAGWQVLGNVALGGLCFLGAWAAFARFCDRADDSADVAVARRRVLGIRWKRPPRPWRHALAWKEFHFVCGGRFGFALRCVGYGLLGALSLASYLAMRRSGVSVGSMSVVLGPSLVSTAFSIDVAVMAARIFGNERREQTLSTLAGLPISLKTLVGGKVRGCLLASIPGALVVSLGSLTFLANPHWEAGALVSALVHFAMQWTSFALLVYLVAFLSLYLLRGALPLGYILHMAAGTILSIIVIALSFSSFAGAPSMIYGSTLIPLASCLGYIPASIIFYRRGLRRLETLAGES